MPLASRATNDELALLVRRRRSPRSVRAVTHAFSDPSSPPGLALWFEADIGTGGVSDGDPVSTWVDKSVNARNLTGTTTTRPLYRLAASPAIPSGLPVLRFDGVDDFLSTSAFVWAQPVTICAVAKYNAAFDAVHRGLTDGAVGTYSLFSYRSGATAMGEYDTGAGFGSSATTPEAWHQWTFVHNSTSSLIRADGVQIGAGDPGNVAISGFSICAEPAAVDVAAVVVYQAVLSASDLAGVEQYLTAKWLVGPAVKTGLGVSAHAVKGDAANTYAEGGRGVIGP